MRIGWMIRGGGVFGSVREALETGNALTRRGHEFFYFCEEGKDTGWLPNTANWRHIEDVATTELDCLFWTDTPDDRYYEAFKASPAKVKSFCVMGFDPDQCGDKFFSDRHHEIITNYWVTCDGAWQMKHLRRYTDNLGPAIGGINLKQFRPVETKQEFDVIWSGDHRERKGGVQVMAAIKGLNAGTYAKKGIRQEDLAEFICRAPIFVDGHKRGGWCNPVLEAMACGRAVVCTDTHCNSDFAEDMTNCIKVPVGDAQAMREAIGALSWTDGPLSMIQDGAIETAARYDYDKVVIPLEAAIRDRL